MSLITRCPACKTTFRVVPDQLRISQGWVRCGQCAEIFDASAQLVVNPLVASPSPGSALAPMPAPDTPSASEFAHFVAPNGQTPEASVTTPDSVDAAVALDAPRVPVVADHSPPVLLQPEASQSIADPSASDQTQPDAAGQVREPWLDAAPVLPDAASAEDEAAGRGMQASEVSFIKQAQTRSLWTRTWVKAFLCLMAIALLGVLAFQILLHERDRIAALHPDAKAWTVSACRPLNCKVSPLRQIDAITIDASSFVKTRLDTYRLSVVLKNSAPYDLAAPALELSLTDSQDQAVIRRVVAQSEFAMAGGVIMADSEWSGNMMITVRPGAGADRVSGYRILAFYP